MRFYTPEQIRLRLLREKRAQAAREERRQAAADIAIALRGRDPLPHRGGECCGMAGCYWVACCEILEPVNREGRRHWRRRLLCQVHAVVYASRHLKGRERRRLIAVACPALVAHEATLEAIRLRELSGAGQGAGANEAERRSGAE